MINLINRLDQLRGLLLTTVIRWFIYADDTTQPESFAELECTQTLTADLTHLTKYSQQWHVKLL